MIGFTLATLTGLVAQVTDGDTLRLATGERIRLAAVDANELSGRCHAACAPRSATAARDNLARLSLGKRVSCETTGRSFNRTVAWCYAGKVNLSCAQLTGGYAVAVPRYDPQNRLGRC